MEYQLLIIVFLLHRNLAHKHHKTFKYLNYIFKI